MFLLDQLCILHQIMILNLQLKYQGIVQVINSKKLILLLKVFNLYIGDRKIIKMRNVVDLGDGGDFTHKPTS